MTPEKILWIRELSCGHERTTEINYILKNYNKPKINSICYCVCCKKNRKVVGIKKLEPPEISIIHKIIKIRDIWVYMCNQACSTTPYKTTRENNKVTCRNCIRAIKKGNII